MGRSDRRASHEATADAGVESAPDAEPHAVQMSVGSTARRPPAGSTRAPPAVDRRLAAGIVLGLGVLLAVVAIGVGRDHAGDAALPGSPTSVVAPRWSVVVPRGPVVTSVTPGRATLEPTVDIVGGVVLHTVRSRAGRVTTLVQRSASTGAVGWERGVEVGTQPVVVEAGRVVVGPTGQWLNASMSGSRSLVGMSLADGSRLWQVPIGGDFVGWMDPDGVFFVSGNAQCGYLDPLSGRFVFLRFVQECLPAADGLAEASPDGWILVDTDGQRVAVVDRGAAVPRLIGELVVAVGGDQVRLVGRDGEERQLPAPRLDRLDDRALGGTHVAGWAGEEQYVLDLDAPRVLGPYSPNAVPVVVDDTLRVIDDGSLPTPDLVASGVWSRSPDANVVRVLGSEGEVVATREMVLAPPMLPTAEGVLLWEQVGTDSRLGLYGYDDLDPIWEVPFRGSPLAGLASSDDLVVASYLDLQGRVRLVGLGPR